MPAVQWEPRMSTGVEAIDSQHRQLISWLNDLLTGMSAGRGRSEIDGLLKQLGMYAALHFGHEEECFARYECPLAERNSAQHKDFVATFQSFREEFDRDGATAALVIRVEAELLRWLTNHILRTDTSLRPCVPVQ
jgi:hemerythrin